MNRRSFLKRSGIGLGAGAAASTITFRSIRPAQAAQATPVADAPVSNGNPAAAATAGAGE